jgi:hypothetical protein
LQINLSKYADLADAKTNALVRIDELAGIARQKYLDKVPGEESVLMEKLAELRALVNDPSPAPANYPFVDAEAQARGITFAQAATYINNLANTWRQKNALIERKRIEAKLAVDLAITTREVENIIIDLEAQIENI